MGETLTRRGFIGAAGAFALLRAQGAEAPLLTVGIVTDTHVGRTRKSCALVKKACELFAAHKVDLFVNCGDIADHHYPEAYPILKELTDAIFADKPVRKLWVYANHDLIDREKEPWETVMADVKRLLGATNDIYDVTEIKGLPFVVFPQWLDYEKAEKILSQTEKEHPGKPIFVLDHFPPRVPKFEGFESGDEKRTELYAKFPRVIQICGHKHGSLRAEHNMWQGAFTSANVGCLFVWQGNAVGNAPKSKKNYGAVIMEVFGDRVVLRRFDVRTGREYEAAHPWTVPLPFEPSAAPYRRDQAAKREPVPQFPKGAKLTLTPDAPFATLSLGFPRAESAHGTYIYKVQVTDERGEPLMRHDFFGQFYLPEDERRAKLAFKLSAGYFDAGKSYRVRVTPCNCFGASGRPIEAAFAAPKEFAPAKVCYESADPMAECPLWTRKSRAKLFRRERRIEARDGWYEIGTGLYWLELPEKIWDGAKGTRFRFTADMETDQPATKTWTVVLQHTGKVKNANNRIQTPRGKSGKTRYVIEFAKKAKDFPCNLLIREGSQGKIRFSHVKLERLG